MSVDEKVEGQSEKHYENEKIMNEIYRFKDLKHNEYFIALPTPGDNKGHGGYLGAHHVFKKISSKQAVRYNLNPMQNIMFNFDEFKHEYDRRYKENITDMSKDMQVIKVD